MPDSGQQFGEVAGELGTELLHAGGLLFGDRQRAVRRKRFVRFGDGDLIMQDGDADVAQDGADMHETAQAARAPGEVAQRAAVLQVKATSGGSSSVSARETQSRAFFKAAVMLSVVF